MRGFFEDSHCLQEHLKGGICMGVGLWNDFSLTASPIWLSRQAAESLRVPKLLSAAETDSLSVSAPPCRSDPSHLRVPISRSPPLPLAVGPSLCGPFTSINRPHVRSPCYQLHPPLVHDLFVSL